MITVTALQDRGGGTDKAINYFTVGEYYLDKEGNAHGTMQWGGKGADNLGLVGKDVDKETMMKLADGFSPEGKPLCRNAGEKPKEHLKFNRKGEPVIDKETGEQVKIFKGGHRIGFDVTCSAPKDVSIPYALADHDEKERILACHKTGVQAAMNFLESKVETRRGQGGKDVIGVKGIVYSQHLHFANRDLEPQLHTHNMVYGVAQGEDGAWSTFDAVEIYRHARTADEIYKMTLYSEMQKLGYTLDRKRELDLNGNEKDKLITSIAGVSQDFVDHFSTRRMELLEYAKEHNVDHQTACLATRKHKDEPTFSELIENWTQTIAGLNPEMTTDIERLKSQVAKKEREPCSNEELLLRLHENDAIFSEKDLVRELAMEYCGLVEPENLMALVEQFKQDTNLIEVGALALAKEDQGNTLAKRHTESRYAAPFMIDAEKEIGRLCKEREDETSHHVPEKIIQEVLDRYEAKRGFNMSDEQKKGINHICRNTGGVAVIGGRAGTGKTAISENYKECFELAGKKLIGIAVSNDAAKKLQEESGIPSISVAQLVYDLKKEKIKFTSRDVVVLDEAGMVATQDTRILMRACAEAGAKLILQGDTKQLQPIAAGSGMKLAQEAIGDTELTEIRRQKDPQARELANVYYGKNGIEDQLKKEQEAVLSRREVSEKGLEILGGLEARGCLDEWNTKQEAVNAMVAEYLDSQFPIEERLALAHSRKEVDQLNEGIRNGLRERGILAEKEAVIRTRQKDEIKQLGFSVGDNIRFGTKNNGLRVINGTQGKIVEIHRSRKNGDVGGFNFTIREEKTGRKIKFNTLEFNNINHNYCITVHKSQGQGKSDIFHLANTGMMDNQSSLVAFTRLTKGQYRLFGTAAEFDTLHERLGLDRLKENATTAGVKEKPVEKSFMEKAKNFITNLEANVLGNKRKEHEKTHEEKGQSETPKSKPAPEPKPKPKQQQGMQR